MLQNLVAGIVLGILALVIGALLSLVGAIPVYFLWNWLMPTVFGIKLITFWQAWGICWLAAALFKSSSSSSSK